MKRKFLVLILFVFMIVGCTAKQSNDMDLLRQIQEKGELVIATEGTWAPWTYHNQDDQLVGFDVELGKLIADKLGVEAVFVEAEWDSLFAGLDAGRYDLVINGVEITDERKEKYDFTEPYAYIKTAIIVENSNDSIHSFEDLEGKQTANTLASTYATLAESYGANPTGVDDLSQTMELVLSGRVDATLNAEVSYYDYIKEHPNASIKIAALTTDASFVSIPLRKNENTESLMNEINKIIMELKESGELSELSNQYFGVDLVNQ
ncbi:transporter substrate-binding domain-containing protein [Anaerorhabdus furcosa]|uniref:Cystine transport system substrate-binding protein n=1 Tax=Anaerorhabdus furcosa TaxID=118967 RepID=A0A1T4K2D7_9FIRM|nr:transporter substrate-binding domain-containing protein [Anaerorhabdus furcosa]SJZ36475.1 cystine transport system substrate-binding protein [Anaerorhabdus furcosa]